MFENLIIKFIENIHIVFIVVAILCFVIPMIYSVVKRKQRKKKRDILDSKTILIDSGVYGGVGFILFHLVFLLVGIIVIYAAITTAENTFSMIFGIVFGIAMCIIPIIISLNSIKTYIRVLNRNYVIIEDELMDKFYYQDRSYHGEGIDQSGWRLYFKHYFKKYDKYVKFRDLREGDNYQIGEKFYLVFVKGGNLYKFRAKEYTLAPSEKDKLKTIDDVKDYVDLEEFVLEKEIPSETIVINKERIINDFFDKKRKRGLVFDILLPIAILLFGIIIYISFSVLFELILVFAVFVFFLIMNIIHIKHILNMIKQIKNNNYEVKEDEIVSLNSRLSYSDSNKMISFKLKNYKKIVYQDRKYFADVKEGDKLYLVFVKGEKEPIKVYNAKYSTISK